MSRFAERSQAPEIMDDLQCSGEVVHQTLRELDFINHWLGGNQVTLKGLKSLIKNQNNIKSFHLADLGCGSGEMLKLIYQQLKTHPILQLTGIDANPNIIAFAEKHCAGIPNLQLKTEDIFDPDFQRHSFDIVIATLFLHHFTHEQLVKIFQTLQAQTRIGIVVNDLHRHPLAYYSIKLLTRLFSRSAMVKYDAPLSVLRGFKKAEIEGILAEAGITRYTLSWRWAFRWQLVIYTGENGPPMRKA
ncbi:MAG: methyltransferase domain-containing protein [Cyclobacteriaceae bacterium]|nr:MAG: methyltransferase domain-containing protein [Cyclobacteriaceae bacterium]